MLWSEFQEGTRCAESEKNREAFKKIEKIYNDSSMSHEDAYAMGRELTTAERTVEAIEYRAKADLEYYLAMERNAQAGVNALYAMGYRNTFIAVDELRKQLVLWDDKRKQAENKCKRLGIDTAPLY